MKVNVLEAKNRLSELIRAVQAGQEVIIARRGKPVARLVPADEPSTPEATRGSAEAILGWLARHPVPEDARRRTADIEVAIESERDVWD